VKILSTLPVLRNELVIFQPGKESMVVARAFVSLASATSSSLASATSSPSTFLLGDGDGAEEDFLLGRGERKKKVN